MSAIEKFVPSIRVHDGQLHLTLAKFNATRFTPALPREGWLREIKAFSKVAVLEGEFLEEERRKVSERAKLCPLDADGFVEWFAELRRSGPGQFDSLFRWLQDEADLQSMRWFLRQEVAGEAGFEDLTALTQVRFPDRPKLELARNYWDEMGRGREKGMHGRMLSILAKRLDLSLDIKSTVWESLALANTMAGLAANRRYAYHSIGALGVVELTAPDRSGAVAAGLKRLGVPPEDRHYFDLHAVLDIKHSQTWNAEVIHPLVSETPAVATAIAEGALMRLEAGRRCFLRYRQHLQV